tara:strand:+ start:368 stop:877 length:510 start_codon:yes stop_codon:yes gene_type:complete
MATKQDIINKVDTDLASGGNIAAVSHRGVLHGNNDSLIENFYGIESTDENTGGVLTSNVITSVSTDLAYKMFITKSGSTVNMTGFIRNSSGTILPANTLFFTITNNEYKVKSSSGINPYRVVVIASSYDTNFATFDVDRVVLQNDELRVTQAVAINSILRFSLTYNTDN